MDFHGKCLSCAQNWRYMAYIARPRYEALVADSVRRNPITAILGPRQSGKTTLARMFAGGKDFAWFDLEDFTDEELLRESPMSVLSQQRELVVIDEIQRLPDLFKVLRVLVDRPDAGQRFLILGSASPHLLKGASESLAGRVGFVDLAGFDLSEVGSEHLDRLWMRGGFPRSYLAADEEGSFLWRRDFIRTFLERDLRAMGIQVAPRAMSRFWIMLAHFHGNLWNGAALASSLGISESSVRRYLDILTDAYMLRQLQPWHENIKKRQVKSPKIFLRDSGLLHALLGIRGEELYRHPQLGASWEGFIIEQILALFPAQSTDAWFWRTHTGAELDLLLMHEGRRLGFEIKRSEKPAISKSMRIVQEDLHLDQLFLIYPGKRRIEVERNVVFLPARDLVGEFSV